jgi:ribose transport system ATP-binding protein
MTAAEPSVRDTPRAAASARGDGLLLELSGVSKFFPGVVALDGVDFDLRPGEVHVLFGENGAGKSTLINIIAGAYAPDAGEFRFRGEGIGRFTPHTARMMGISPMFQDCDARAGAEIIAELGFDLHPDRKVGRLSRAHQQMVEIVKALLADVRLLILDEPTASLTESEAASLFDLIAKLKASGVGIIYVPHRMREIKQIADRAQDRRVVPAHRSPPGENSAR